MKLYIKIVIISIFSICLNANELSWVDTQVNAIKPTRKGMSESEISKIKDPFVFYNKRKTKRYTKPKKSSKVYSSVKKSTSNKASNVVLKQPSKPFVLSAIINNSALINGQWYKLNENVDSFKLSSINRTNVVLTKGSGKLVLTTNDRKRNLKFK